MKELRFRYPGVIPFTKKEKNLFYGREKDIDKICRFLALESLIVLHSKSGIGKTSIINAGIKPWLNERNSNLIIKEVRLNNYTPLDPKDPCEIVEDILETKDTILNRIPVKKGNFWLSFKNILLSQNLEANREILLILDQFEELFTYPSTEVNNFAEQIGHLYNKEMPAEVRKAIRRGQIIDNTFDKDIESQNLEEWLTEPLNIKILVSIRSDRLHLVNRLKVDIPEILINTYELEALSLAQAKDAIIQPALQSGEFASQKFEYSSNAVNKILEFLTNRNINEKIESFELQVICKFVEQNIIKNNLTRVEAFNLGADLSVIIRNYYENQLENLSKSERRKAQVFIEERLIEEEDGGPRRISLDEAIARTIVSKSLLDKLVNSHLIRRQVNSIGKYSFELSHDTLIEPIRKAKSTRLKIEEIEETKRVAKEKNKALLRKAIIGGILVVVISAISAIVIESNRKGSQLEHANILLNERKQDLDSLNLELEDQQKKIGEINDTLVNELDLKNQKIDSILGRGKLQTTNLKALREVIDEKDEIIRVLSQDSEQKTNSLQLLRLKLDSLQRAIILQRSTSTISNANKNLKTELSSKDEYIQELRKELARADAEIQLKNEMIKIFGTNNPREMRKMIESESQKTRDLRYRAALSDRKVKELEIELSKYQKK